MRRGMGHGKGVPLLRLVSPWNYVIEFAMHFWGKREARASERLRYDNHAKSDACHFSVPLECK